ncbi:CocE/NonD family hydrolase [Amycolatopsis thermoflava]|nr:CocE/NonD family hydrolase [Amycolatopsis thermoflava]
MRWEFLPPPEAARRVLHLAGGADGQLASRRDAAATAVSWVHDPDKLVPTATNLWSLLVAEWPDYRATTDRDDVLAFRGEPQTEALELAGPVTFHGTVTTTGPEMDLFAFLLDLEPDGSARFICRGQQRLTATDPTEVTMSVGEAGYVVRPGHSLLLMLCSSDYPDFIPLTGTTERWWFATSMRPTTQTLEIGGRAGARLELTVL